MRILYDPYPRTTSEIFSDEMHHRFIRTYKVLAVRPENRDADYDTYLPQADVIISQQPMGRDRLVRATGLKAIFNVETNFLPNIDYAYCFERGIHVLAPSAVFAEPVAEMGLGLALSLARDIHTAHADFRAGQEQYGLAGNMHARLLAGADMGFIGYGDLGRALHRLLGPFRPRLRVFDPWIPDNMLRRFDLEPATLDHVLETSQCLFVLASVTSENQLLLNAERLALMPDGSSLILLSRAALADFDALAREADSGRLRIATDVFPQEPVPQGDPIRTTRGMLFSAHRAGALTSALEEIGSRVLDDLELINKGLPPLSCRRAERETVGRMRIRPIART